MGAHAYLQPSSASRWTVCPGSVHLSSGMPDSDPSEAAAMGTACHKMFEEYVKAGKHPMGRVGELILVTDQNVDKAVHVEVTEEMAEWVVECIGWVAHALDMPGVPPHERPLLRVEERAHCGAYYGCPDAMWGTADIVIADHARLHLTVADEKYGFNEVDAEGNQQLQLYAIGIMHDYGWAFKTIRTVILQPRSPVPVKEYTYTSEELLDVAKRLAPKVRDALQAGAPLVPSEDGCKWCPAAGGCPALQSRALALVRSEFASPETLDRDQLVSLLEAAPMIRAGLDAVEKHATQLLALGVDVPGFKRVYGNKRRVWKIDEERVGDVLLKLHVPKDKVWPRKLGLTPPQAEKLVGAACKDLLAPFIETPTGEPQLARADDQREEVPPDFAPEVDLLA